MRRNKFVSIFLILVLCLAFCLSGCNLGTYLENNTERPPVNNGSEDDPNKDPGGEPVTPDDTHYTVSVFYNNQPFNPGDTEITVVWHGNNSVTRQTLDSKGKADAGELDGDFDVYLLGLPDIYTYNPNGYSAPDETGSRQISILLTSVRKPSSGDGSNMYGNYGCYQTRYEGTYRAAIAREGQVLYYEFTPRASGVYVVESWVNIYDDEIDPYVDLYSGTSANKWFNRTLEGGGAATEGGYTQNFRWELAVDQSEVGAAFTFAVGARSKSKTYPVYVDFEIKWLSSYSSAYADIRPQAAKEARGMTPEPAEGESFVFADLGTKVFDAKKFRKSPNTGRYHLYDTEKYGDNPYGYGRGYGPMLMCAITKAIESYTDIPSLYEANRIGPNGSNYLMLYNTWIEEEQKFATFDYTNFIRVDYYRVCNSDGVCYVTDELITFLQKFAENHALYTDGVLQINPDIGLSGTPELKGYTANQDSLWMFACGIYQ